jgi:hypothetical protein
VKRAPIALAIATLALWTWLAAARGSAEPQPIDGQMFERLIRTEEARNRSLDDIKRALERIADRMPQR